MGWQIYLSTLEILISLSFWLPLLLRSFCCSFVGWLAFFGGVFLIFSLTLVFCSCIIIFYLIYTVLSVALSHQLWKIRSTISFNIKFSYDLFFPGVPIRGTLNFLSISLTFLNLFNISYNPIFMCCILDKFFSSMFQFNNSLSTDGPKAYSLTNSNTSKSFKITTSFQVCYLILGFDSLFVFLCFCCCFAFLRKQPYI